eukprot:gene124-3514_t
MTFSANIINATITFKRAGGNHRELQGRAGEQEHLALQRPSSTICNTEDPTAGAGAGGGSSGRSSSISSGSSSAGAVVPVVLELSLYAVTLSRSQSAQTFMKKAQQHPPPVSNTAGNTADSALPWMVSLQGACVQCLVLPGVVVAVSIPQAHAAAGVCGDRYEVGSCKM